MGAPSWINFKEKLARITVSDSGYQTGGGGQKGGHQPLILELKPIIWNGFCPKLHESGRNWTEGASVLDLPMNNTGI